MQKAQWNSQSAQISNFQPIVFCDPGVKHYNLRLKFSIETASSFLLFIFDFLFQSLNMTAAKSFYLATQLEVLLNLIIS